MSLLLNSSHSKFCHFVLFDLRVFAHHSVTVRPARLFFHRILRILGRRWKLLPKNCPSLWVILQQRWPHRVRRYTRVPPRFLLVPVPLECCFIGKQIFALHHNQEPTWEAKYVSGKMNSKAVAKLKKMAQTLTSSIPLTSLQSTFWMFMIWKKML